MILRRITRPWDVQPSSKLRWVPPAGPAPSPPPFRPRLIDHGGPEEESFDRHVLGWLLLRPAPAVVDILGPQLLKHPPEEEEPGERRNLGIAWLFRPVPPVPGLLKPIALLKHPPEEEEPGERRNLGIAWLFAVPVPPPPVFTVPPGRGSWWFTPWGLQGQEFLMLLGPDDSPGDES